MFKVGDLVVLPSYTKLRKDVFQLTHENMILYNKHGICFRHATPEEIAAGHRIECEVLEMADVSPNCEVRNV